MRSRKAKGDKGICDLRKLSQHVLYVVTPDLLLNFPDALYADDTDELGKRCFVVSNVLINIYTKFSSAETQNGEISAELIYLLSTIQQDGKHSSFTSTDGQVHDVYTLNNVSIILDNRKHSFDLETDIEKEGLRYSIATAEYWSEQYPHKKFKDGVTLLTNDRAISLYLSKELQRKYNLTILDPSIHAGYRVIPADNELYALWLNSRGSKTPGIPVKEFQAALKDQPPLAKNEYVVFGDEFSPNGNNIGFYNYRTQMIEPLQYLSTLLTSAKSTEQNIVFDMLGRARANPDINPYVIVAGPQGTGKTYSVVLAMLSMTEPFRKRALMQTHPQLEEPDQVRTKPDGTETKVNGKHNPKKDPCYQKGSKKKSKSDPLDILSELSKDSDSFSRILVVVPDKQMGAKTETLPGDRMAKMAPKIAAMRELLAQAIMQIRKQSGLVYSESLCFSIADEIMTGIEFVTMGELSSRSPTNALIILDEGQFHTPAQIRLAIGRPAEGSILVILADPYQTMNRFGAMGNSVAMVMRRVCGKAPFLTIVTRKPVRNGPKLMEGIRI